MVLGGSDREHSNSYSFKASHCVCLSVGLSVCLSVCLSVFACLFCWYGARVVATLGSSSSWQIVSEALVCGHHGRRLGRWRCGTHCCKCWSFPRPAHLCFVWRIAPGLSHPPPPVLVLKMLSADMEVLGTSRFSESCTSRKYRHQQKTARRVFKRQGHDDPK